MSQILTILMKEHCDGCEFLVHYHVVMVCLNKLKFDHVNLTVIKFNLLVLH